MNNIKITYCEDNDILHTSMRTDKEPLDLYTYDLSRYNLPDRTNDTFQKFLIAQFTNSVWALSIDRESK